MTDRDDWRRRVVDATPTGAGPTAALIADRLWPYVGALINGDRTLGEALFEETMPSPTMPNVQVPTLTWLADLNPHVGREVTQIQAAIKRLHDEHEARALPPHQDSSYGEGVSRGLALALHIITNGAACDQDECSGHETQLLTEIPLVP